MDFYCERIDLSFWAEPVNALTNLGFVLAGLLALSLLSRQQKVQTHKAPIYLTLLPGFMIIIGTGSFLFHTFASFWAMLADIIPIYLYQIIFLWSYLRFALKLSALASVGVFILFIGCVVATKLMPFDINGSEMYLPSILILVLFSAAHKIKYHKFDRPLLIASLCFCISLTMRTIDNAICERFPLGTHFGWHLFNAAVLFFTWYSLFKVQTRAASIKSDGDRI